MVVVCRLHLLLDGDSNDEGNSTDPQARKHTTDVGLMTSRWSIQTRLERRKEELNKEKKLRNTTLTLRLISGEALHALNRAHGSLIIANGAGKGRERRREKERGRKEEENSGWGKSCLDG